MPVKNEIKALPALLAALVDQDCDSFEIIVADGGSTDRTREFVAQFASTSRVPVILVDNAKIRSGPGRNAGARQASGEIIVFLDGHCTIPSRSLLRDTIALFEYTAIDCLCRPQPLLAHTNSATGKLIAAVRASTLGHGRDSLIYDTQCSGFVDPASSGASYRRRVFDTIGFYDETFDACEDVEFNTRLRKAGMKAYTDPRLTVHYEPRGSLRALARQMANYGTGRIRLAFKHPDSISVTQFVPLGLLLLAALAAMSLPFAGLVRTALLSILTLYFALVIAASVQLARKHSARYFWQAPPVYLAIHFGLGWGMLRELFSRRTPSQVKRHLMKRQQICS
jgi:glycosyltransferase involved in cell wall biosynthesis